MFQDAETVCPVRLISQTKQNPLQDFTVEIFYKNSTVKKRPKQLTYRMKTAIGSAN